ncbi:MAG: demethoxyubiquinone hydroxylase family protein [Hyphomonadaceae bacterium]
MSADAPPFPADGARRRRLESMIRVDHAGEFAAVQIYKGQRAVFDRIPGKAHAAELIAEMEEGEQEHLRTFDALIAERNVRPTVMAPVWRVAAFGLGAATALMGEKAAHACTAAVEEVIEEHYESQVRALPDEEAPFRETIARFRDDEAGHRATALSEGAEEAPGYRVLSAVIKAGCRLAIRISERV